MNCTSLHQAFKLIVPLTHILNTLLSCKKIAILSGLSLCSTSLTMLSTSSQKLSVGEPLPKVLRREILCKKMCEHKGTFFSKQGWMMWNSSDQNILWNINCNNLMACFSRILFSKPPLLLFLMENVGKFCYKRPIKCQMGAWPLVSLQFLKTSLVIIIFILTKSTKYVSLTLVPSTTHFKLCHCSLYPFLT